jgi:hypothetical protein
MQGLQGGQQRRSELGQISTIIDVEGVLQGQLDHALVLAGQVGLCYGVPDLLK